MKNIVNVACAFLVCFSVKINDASAFESLSSIGSATAGSPILPSARITIDMVDRGDFVVTIQDGPQVDRSKFSGIRASRTWLGTAISRAIEGSSDALILVRANEADKFQRLAHVIDALMSQRQHAFQLTTSQGEVSISLPSVPMQDAKVSINLFITAKGDYTISFEGSSGIDSWQIDAGHSRDTLAGAISKAQAKIGVKQIFVHVDRDALVTTYGEAMAAIQAVGIEKSWIVGLGVSAASEIEAVRLRIRQLEGEQKALQQRLKSKSR